MPVKDRVRCENQGGRAVHFGMGLPIDQHEVGLNVAVAAILPVAGQRMVAVPVPTRNFVLIDLLDFFWSPGVAFLA